MYLAERMLDKDEKFDPENHYHTLLLYYAALVLSNKGKKVPDVMEFVGAQTSKSLTEIGTYFWEEWNRLEGNADKGKEGDSKNA